MHIVFGNRLFGKVDVIAGVGHVATRFFHVYYVPIVPMNSVLVLSGTGGQYEGITVPLSVKSILMAWVRSLSIVAAIVASCISLVDFLLAKRASDHAWVTTALAALAAIGLLVLTKSIPAITRASYERACQLCELATISEARTAVMRKAYGRTGERHGFAPPFAPTTAEPVRR